MSLLDAGGLVAVADTGTWQFSYQMEGGFADRGFVPSLPADSLSAQQLEDTLPYYRPSAAHVVAGIHSGWYLPTDATYSNSYTDSSGVVNRVEMASVRRDGMSLPCGDAGCPISRVSTYRGDTLVLTLWLTWRMLPGAYELEKVEAEIFDADNPQAVRATVTAPVDFYGSVATRSNGNRALALARAGWKIVADGSRRVMGLLAPRSAWAQQLCLTEAAVAIGANVMMRSSLREAAATGFLNRAATVKAIVSTVTAIAATENWSKCLRKNYGV